MRYGKSFSNTFVFIATLNINHSMPSDPFNRAEHLQVVNRDLSADDITKWIMSYYSFALRYSVSRLKYFIPGLIAIEVG